ncbi:LPS assembly lipoprotein LptE [Bacteroidales bacterium OttesenSCG-928-M11]|nr:LPS assembly lipoprotein LptE [Bacteroidales bacterium OttesenSCG-928-M11]
MVWNKKQVILTLFITLLITSCSFSYKFDGGTINYDLTKTITIHEFPNRAAMVNTMLSQILDQELNNRFIEQTRLTPVSANGDIEISGEITQYTTQDLGVKEDTYASMTKLIISVRVDYENTKEQGQDISGQTFTAYREFDSTNTLLSDVEDELCRQICEELVDQIYNATVANW